MNRLTVVCFYVFVLIVSYQLIPPTIQLLTTRPVAERDDVCLLEELPEVVSYGNLTCEERPLLTVLEFCPKNYSNILTVTEEICEPLDVEVKVPFTLYSLIEQENLIFGCGELKRYNLDSIANFRQIRLLFVEPSYWTLRKELKWTEILEWSNDITLKSKKVTVSEREDLTNKRTDFRVEEVEDANVLNILNVYIDTNLVLFTFTGKVIRRRRETEPTRVRKRFKSKQIESKRNRMKDFFQSMGYHRFSDGESEEGLDDKITSGEVGTATKKKKKKKKRLEYCPKEQWTKVEKRKEDLKRISDE